MSANFYSQENIQNLAKIRDYAPEQFQAFDHFNRAIFNEGALSIKEKEIIAVAIAHITQCPYCIDSHTKKAKKAGASLEELVEAVFVATAVEAGGAVTHGTHVFNAKDADASDVLYARSNLKKLQSISQFAPEGFKGYSALSNVAMKEGKLTAKFKEIIATASGIASQCPYCIDVHTKKAEKLGATSEELAEAILVASSLRAGGCYAHMANMMESYQT